jgi:hypothetical protein
MVLCLLSRDSHGDTGKLNHEETVRGPETSDRKSPFFPKKVKFYYVVLILVKILKRR